LIVTPKRRRNAERLLNSAKIKAEWGPPPSSAEIIQRDNERLLADMTLEGEVSEEERTMVARLLKAYTPEHIATSFIRQYRAGHSAPEELTHVAYDPDDKRGRGNNQVLRSDFSNGVWFWLNLAV